MEKEQPSYVVVLTSDVRYDKKLSNLEKLLYAEVVALSGEIGFCFVTNSYFSDLYDVSKDTISRRLNHIKEVGYLDIQMLYEGKRIVGKKIRLLT